ncbi:M56 family metallopeptidase [Curtobacterium sp. MCBD17_035]|uniref:M56 family metallopeptidase n=1 Tax=Curtobacterium sp. MCBD17_035 TaxID=2175673 RepID=UPI000DAA7F5C|nr:M56 family metallopeptidase [Curtobacterium sp. MCBD17_035]WIB66724.1 M56 family metallopeptidase [Curtobacterium sp. MCBD17_035]
MIVWGVALVVTAVVVAAAAPRLLTRWAWTIDRPRTALVSWCAAVLIGVGGSVSGVTLVALGSRHGADPFRLAASPTHGAHLVVAVAAVLAFVVAVRVPPGPEHAAVRAALRTGAAERRRVAGTEIAVVAGERALACAVPGRDRTVLVSTGLAARLRPDELDAVVAHEAAHLTGHHAAVVGVAASIERAVPWVPGARAMASATRVLVEFAADDTAARRVGAEVVARAIERSDVGGAAPLTGVRVARLRRPATPGQRRWRAAPVTSRKKSA